MTELTLIQTDETAAETGCSCCATPSADLSTADATVATAEEPTVSDTATAATTSVYTVTGMTCGHCVTSVTEEVSAISGVRDVAVDLASGRVTVTSDAALDLDAVKAAVDEAGYQLAG